MWPDYDAEHYEALHNLDYYDSRQRGSTLGWVANDFIPHSPFVDRRADRLAMERAAQSAEDLRKTADRKLLKDMGVDGNVSLAEARKNAGLPA